MFDSETHGGTRVFRSFKFSKASVSTVINVCTRKACRSNSALKYDNYLSRLKITHAVAPARINTKIELVRSS